MNSMTDRTPERIATEINVIKEQAREVFCRSAIEIGRRLFEAKSIIPHGSWGKWLEENVDYSERTAQNLMRVYEEYGRNANPQAIADLSYTQAVILLGLDRETRAELMETQDVAGMSTRELQEEVDKLNREIAERQVTIDQLIARDTNSERLKEAEAAWAEAEAAAERMRNEREDALKAASTARQQAQDAVDRANQLSNEAARLRTELKNERNKPAPAPEIEYVEVLPPDVAAELKDLRSRAQNRQSETVVQLRIHYKQMTDIFGTVKADIAELNVQEPEEARRYRAAVARAARMMADQIEGI